MLGKKRMLAWSSRVGGWVSRDDDEIVVKGKGAQPAEMKISTMEYVV